MESRSSGLVALVGAAVLLVPTSLLFVGGFSVSLLQFCRARMVG